MAEGGSEGDKKPFLEPSFENTEIDINKVNIPSVSSDNISSQNANNIGTMHRYLRQIKSFLDVLWLQCPGFMLVFYLCYLCFGGIIFILLSLLSIAAFLYTFQDSLLYQPNTPPDSRHFVMTPSQFNLPFEDLFLLTKDGLSLHSFFIKQPLPSSAYTVLVLHGNAGNIGHRLYNCQMLYQQCHVNIMLVEYRGYGRSEGTPSEEGLVIDATTALDHLLSRDDINHHRIIIFGRSLGGAVAIATATTKANVSISRAFPAGMILENTFTSIKDMASNMVKIPFVSLIPDVFVKNKFNSIDHIPHLHPPTLFISALQDEIVPPYMMKKLYERSGSVMKRFYQLPNGSHNECWRLPGYFNNISQFIREIEQANNPTNQTT